MKSSKSLLRKPPIRQQAPRMLVVVEGEVTEVEYLNALKRSRRMRSLDVEIETGHTDPIGIVNAAKMSKRNALRTDPYDAVWCVFDVEAKLTQTCRARLPEALNSASDSGIEIAVSNPCLEIWLLWHLENQQAWISSEAVQKRCKDLRILSDGKHSRDGSNLIAQSGAAKVRATSMEAIHNEVGRAKPEDRNPSSGMYKLVDSICAAFPARQNN